MRLFSAIVPPGEVLDSLAAALDTGATPDDRVRWASRPQWHLTLAFYGSDDLATRSPWLAARVAEHPPVRLQLAGAGTFTGVLWTGVDGDLDALHHLAVAAGGGSEARPYHPHLTLARWKHPRHPGAVQAAESSLATYRGPLWQAAEVVLMRSHPGAGGSRYEPLERYPLAGKKP